MAGGDVEHGGGGRVLERQQVDAIVPGGAGLQAIARGVIDPCFDEEVEFPIRVELGEQAPHRRVQRFAGIVSQTHQQADPRTLGKGGEGPLALASCLCTMQLVTTNPGGVAAVGLHVRAQLARQQPRQLQRVPGVLP